MFFVLISCFLYPIVVIQSYMGRDNMKKKLNNVLNQNVNMTTKRARFSTFVISIVDNLCVQQQYKWNTIKI